MIVFCNNIVGSCSDSTIYKLVIILVYVRQEMKHNVSHTYKDL